MDFLDFLGADDEAPAAAVPADSESESESEADLAAAAAAAESKRFSTLLQISLTRLRGALTPDSYTLLQSQGYLVLDSLFEPELARAFGREIEALHAGGHTGLNSTAFVAEHAPGEKPRIATLIPKPGVWETELTGDVSARLGVTVIPRLTSLFDALPKLEAHLAALGGPALGLSVSQGKSSIKIQQNLGRGGCFPFHFDSPGGLKDSRRITCLLYLNEGWREGDGGELELQPFLRPLVRIAPQFNRIAIFLSDSLLHRVSQSWKPRKCLTIWMHRDTSKDEVEGTTAAAAVGAEATAAGATKERDQSATVAPSPTASPEPSSSGSWLSPAPSPSPSASPPPTADAAAATSSSSSASAPTSPSAADEESGAGSSSSGSGQEDFASLWLSRLSDPAWQRVLSRAVYLPEWRQSFIEAHGSASDETRATEAQERVAYADAESAAASSGSVSSSAPLYERGAEPLVASLERDAERLGRQLSGTGILELIRQTAEEQRAKTIVL